MAYGDSITKDELSGRSTIDIMARIIYQEARGESDTGRKGVICVIKNRLRIKPSEFGSTLKEVMLKSGAFSIALSPDTTSTAWEECLKLAKDYANCESVVGNCCWFNTNSSYQSHITTSGDDEYYAFSSGGSATKVTEKYIIGNHTFFLLYGYGS